jgi:adenylate kinase family enzyme
MKIFLMMGTTLAGKTTHGKLLADETGGAYISSGDIARSLMDAKTDAAFARGQLSPHDAKILGLIWERLENTLLCWGAGSAAVIDGYPRTADHVLHLLEFINTHLTYDIEVVVVHLDAARHVICHRAARRERDKFDTQQVVIERDELYRRETQPAFERLMRVRPNCVRISIPIGVDRPVAKVHAVLLRKLRWVGVL